MKISVYLMMLKSRWKYEVMNVNRLQNACRIIVQNGRHCLAMPDGTPIPRQISVDVKSTGNEMTIAVVTVFVNLDDTVMTSTGERFPAEEMAAIFKPYDNKE